MRVSALMNFSPGGGTRPSTVIGPQANIWLSGNEVTAPAAITPGRRSSRCQSLVIGSPDRLLVLVLRAAHGEFERQNIVRIESRRHVLGAQKAADQQARADQQHGAQRQFGNHQQMAKTVAASPHGADAGRGPAGVLQSVLHIDSPKRVPLARGRTESRKRPRS